MTSISPTSQTTPPGRPQLRAAIEDGLAASLIDLTLDPVEAVLDALISAGLAPDLGKDSGATVAPRFDSPSVDSAPTETPFHESLQHLAIPPLPSLATPPTSPPSFQDPFSDETQAVELPSFLLDDDAASLATADGDTQAIELPAMPFQFDLGPIPPLATPSPDPAPSWPSTLTAEEPIQPQAADVPTLSSLVFDSPAESVDAGSSPSLGDNPAPGFIDLSGLPSVRVEEPVTASPPPSSPPYPSATPDTRALEAQFDQLIEPWRDSGVTLDQAEAAADSPVAPLPTLRVSALPMPSFEPDLPKGKRPLLGLRRK